MSDESEVPKQIARLLPDGAAGEILKDGLIFNEWPTKNGPYTAVDFWHPTEEEARLITNAILEAVRTHIDDLGDNLKPRSS